ncbi:MAG: hypothetical protein ACPLPS_03455 [bacterium]
MRKRDEYEGGASSEECMGKGGVGRQRKGTLEVNSISGRITNWA